MGPAAHHASGERGGVWGDFYRRGGALQAPEAPEPAGALAGLLPLGRDLVLVALGLEQAVFGEVDGDPAGVLRPQASGVVDAGSGDRVLAVLLRVRVADHGGPGGGQPLAEVLALGCPAVWHHRE